MTMYKAGSHVPVFWYKAKYDAEKYPDFEFKFEVDCFVEHIDGVANIKPVNGSCDYLLVINNISDAEIDFPSHLDCNG